MKRQQMVLPWVLLVIPVLWLAALLASGYKDGMTLFDLMAVFPTLMEKPFAIHWTPHTLKFLLIGLAVYGYAVTLYFSASENRRPGEEHGSARWGNVRQLNRKYLSGQYIISLYRPKGRGGPSFGPAASTKGLCDPYL